MVTMISVVSSNVESVGYDSARKEVHVKFLNGSTYKYLGVPEGLFQQLLHADSVGGFLNRSIKNVFPFEKVS